MTADSSPPPSDGIAVDAQNPWPGLEAFKEEDHTYFHGREREIDELHRLVLRDRLTVLFGVSGLGKTSLLQAGLFPALRNENILPVRIRLNFSDGMPSLAAQVKDAIAEEARASRIEAPSLKGTLWEAFHREPSDFWNARNRVVIPLLVFDQFEEIFTRGHETTERARDTETLLTELADLIEARAPADLKARIDVNPDEAEAFSFQRHDYKILLSLREDFLADLESLSPRMPSVMHNRLRLCAMNGEQALAAVLRSGAHLIGKDVAARVVRFVGAENVRGHAELANLNVEPALLSVFCRELNLTRIEHGVPEITGELLEGRQAEILASFYERGVAGITPATRAFIEDSLVTAAGRRNSEPFEEALSKPGVTRDDIARLVDRRILRVEDRAGMPWLELTHDRLTGVVGASRDSRRQREAQAAAEAAEQEALDNAARAREELRRKTRTLRMVRGLLVAASIGLIAAVAGAVFGFREQRRAQAAAASEREANHLAQEALADSHFREAMDLVEHDLAAESLPYLGSALRLSPDQPAIQAYTASLLSSRNWPLPVRVTPTDAELEAVRLSPSGKLFATADRDGHARLWDARTGLAKGPELVHGSVVTSVGFSGDGTRLVTASEDRTAVVWNVETARRIAGPFRHSEAVRWAGLTLDGTAVLTVSADGAATLWDVATGMIRARLRGDDAEMVTVARLSRDGRFAVTGTADGVAHVWDLQTMALVASLAGHKKRIHDVQFSPDGQRVLTTSADNTARIWDARSGRPIGVPMKHANVVWDGDFSPDGRLAATASDDGTVGIWSAETGLPAIDFIHHATAVYTIEFSRDGRRIVTTSADYTARVWDVATGRPLTERMRHGDWLDASFNVDGTGVITASWDRTLRMWDVRASASAENSMRHSAHVLSARFSPSGRYVLTTAADDTSRVWDAETLAPASAPMTHRGEVRLAEFSPDEARVMTVAHDGSATIWSGSNWAQRQPVGPPGSIGLSADWSRLLTAVSDHEIELSDVGTGAPAGPAFHSEPAITSASVSPDGRRVVIITDDGQAKIIDAAGGQPVGSLSDRGGIGFARFSPDGARLVTASKENTTRVWDARTGRPVGGPLRHYDTVTSAEFSKDGSRLVTASRERAFIWNVDRSELVGQPMVHQDDVLSVAFSPNGRMVVTASRDRTARIWDADTGEPESEPLRHGAAVRHAEFNATGTHVVTASDDGTARVWEVFNASRSDAGLLASLAETVAGSSLGMRGPAVPLTDQMGQITRLRQQTAGAAGHGAAAFVRWFLADRGTRANAPWSDASRAPRDNK